MTREDTVSSARQRYTAAWRWHFFAGVAVIPFLLVLATTGLVMLYYTAVETPVGDQLYVVHSEHTRTSPVQQLAAAQRAVPGGVVALYIPASAPDRTAQFEVKQRDRVHVIDIDPYTGRVLRVADKDSTLYALAHRIHGTLLLGDIGDTIVEVVAGLALLMLATGLYMWAQQRGGPGPAPSRRNGWRRWHRQIGLYASVVLSFFLLSGLAWTDVWGGKFVQAWNSFPAQKFGPGTRSSGDSHSALNHGAHKQVPWGLEQTPLPASARPSAHGVDLDAVDRRARELGFGPRYRINLPQAPDGVYTISSTSMSGDIDRPGDERTVHLDRHSGEIVAEVAFADYSLLAKSMAVGVAVHQGSFGWWSVALDVLACVSVIVLCISGTAMWWLRRPARTGWLPTPPRVSSLPLRSSVAQPGLTVLLLAMGIAFPLLGAALLCGLLVYALAARRTR